MCPTGECTDNFLMCPTDNYKCDLNNLQRCSDGKCRVNCEDIQTNGCPINAPYYCPDGRCVTELPGCMSYRCDLYKPFLCADLSCVSDIRSCRLNHLSYTIKEISYDLLLREEDTIDINIQTLSELDSNLKALEFRFVPNRLYYSPYTAGYSVLGA